MVLEVPVKKVQVGHGSGPLMRQHITAKARGGANCLSHLPGNTKKVTSVQCP
jgi:hypothetical protein